MFHRTRRNRLARRRSRELLGRIVDPQFADVSLGSAVVEGTLLRIADLDPVHLGFRFAVLRYEAPRVSVVVLLLELLSSTPEWVGQFQASSFCRLTWYASVPT